MLWKVGLNEQRERNNKSKVTQELVEREVKKKKNIQEIQARKEESHLHTYEERRKNSTVKAYEKLGKINDKKWYVYLICQGRKKVTKLYLNIPYLIVSICYKLRKSYRDPKSCIENLKH